ncbi:hypothetical protein HYALB_00010260 [Hymenoscyphus albidus]|uniref:Amidoligase enzyme n=1 Tax=Hymenoscyphus albidus TaxID=595503 RepID=A0A9N9LXH6_9HELO|nr:hypothetical protein HYALB_00010260 [Hymenoscyphus albidus]
MRSPELSRDMRMVLREERTNLSPEHQPKYQETPARKRPRITFGVEFEFNIAYKQSGEDPDRKEPRPIRGIVLKDRDFDDPRWENTPVKFPEAWEHVAETLRAAGISARNKWDTTREPMEDWIVKSDISVGAQLKSYSFLGIEVTSPPLYDCKKSRMRVASVCSVLCNKYRIICNSSTGLHCHVAFGRLCYSPRTLTNPMAVCWAFTDRLELIHPITRRAGRGNAFYCESMRINSVLARTLEEQRGIICQLPEGVEAGLRQILAHRNDRDHTAIWNLTRNMDRQKLACNNSNLAGLTEGMKVPTIEFRQHAGTLGPERVTAWTRVACRLVEFADKIGSAELDAFLWKYRNNRDFTVLDLLKALDLPKQAAYYNKWFEEHCQWLSNDRSFCFPPVCSKIANQLVR